MRNKTLILLLLTGALVAHPFDQRQVESRSAFVVLPRKVQLEIKFPVHAYINTKVKSRAEYDSYAAGLNRKEETGRIEQFLKKNIRLFNGRDPLKMKLLHVKFQHDEYLSDPGPIAIICRAEYRADRDLDDLYVLNQMFEQTATEHNGRARIEVGEKVYDFVFRGKNYFRLQSDRLPWKKDDKNTGTLKP